MPLSGLSLNVLCICVATCWADLCAGTSEGPSEMAGSQVVETMGGEVPPQQTELDELTPGVAQRHLKEERCVRWGLAHVHFYPT